MPELIEDFIIDPDVKTDKLRSKVEAVLKDISTIDFGLGGSKGGGAGASEGADLVGTLMEVGMKIFAPLFAIVEILKSSALLQQSLKLLMVGVQLLLKPIGDVIGGIVLATFRVLYPLVRMLYIMWLPHQQKIMQAIAAMGQSGNGNDMDMAGVIGAVAVEGAAFIGQAFAAVGGEITTQISDIMFGLGEILAAGLGGLTYFLLSALPGGNAYAEEGARFFNNLAIGMKQANVATNQFINEGVQGIVQGLSPSEMDSVRSKFETQWDVIAVGIMSSFSEKLGKELETGLVGVGIGAADLGNIEKFNSDLENANKAFGPEFSTNLLNAANAAYEMGAQIKTMFGGAVSPLKGDDFTQNDLTPYSQGIQNLGNALGLHLKTPLDLVIPTLQRGSPAFETFTSRANTLESSINNGSPLQKAFLSLDTTLATVTAHIKANAAEAAAAASSAKSSASSASSSASAASNSFQNLTRSTSSANPQSKYGVPG